MEIDIKVISKKLMLVQTVQRNGEAGPRDDPPDSHFPTPTHLPFDPGKLLFLYL